MTTANAVYEQSFERSMISDTLDALSYEIHLNEINITQHTIDATNKALLASKIDGLEQVMLELLS